jgi:glutamine amidotransferase
MIAIVDYGMGNLRSVQKALEHVGADARIARTPGEMAKAEKIVLPGVGAFRDAIAQIRSQGFVEPIREAIDGGTPFLGICLGLQMLFDVSYEDGEYEGLGILPGKVVRFDFTAEQAATLPVPHIGWNQVRSSRPCPMLDGIEDGTYFYFVHSYYVVPREATIAATTTEYGYEFVSAVWRDNLFATQFHPEKSQAAGLRLLQNFVKA